MLKDWVGCGWGVASTELLVWMMLGGFVAVLAAQYLLFNKIRQLFVNLDLQLAATIGKLLEEMPFEGMEPGNPVQQWLMQAAMNSIQPPAMEIIPPKDEKGRYR